METFSVLLAICAGNSPVTAEFPARSPVTRSFHVFFDLRLNKRLIKQSWGWWFEMASRPLWRHCNPYVFPYRVIIYSILDIHVLIKNIFQVIFLSYFSAEIYSHWETTIFACVCVHLRVRVFLRMGNSNYRWPYFSGVVSKQKQFRVHSSFCIQRPEDIVHIGYFQ